MACAPKKGAAPKMPMQNPMTPGGNPPKKPVAPKKGCGGPPKK